MSPGDQLLAQGNRGTRITLQFRILLDEATDQWGIKVMTVELKDLDLPVEEGLRRAAARAEMA